MEEINCECDIETMSHLPGQCNKNGSIHLYQRGEQKLWLCGDCYLGSDILLSRDGSAETAMQAQEQLNLIREKA